MSESNGFRPRLKSERVSADEVDWTFASDPEALHIIEHIASQVATTFKVSPDDLYQAALLYVASRPGVPLRQMSLARYLKDEARRESKLSSATVGTVEEWEQELGLESTGMVFDPYENTCYPKALVERLLEGMWNEWVVVDEFRPDADMPRAKPNPKLSGTAMAHKVDIERAWQRADLSPIERGALYLTIGQGLTHEAAGVGLDCHHTTVSRAVERALRGLLVELNQEEL